VLIICSDQQTWLYRIIPAANHGPFSPKGDLDIPCGLDEKLHFTPTQIRWDPFDFDEAADWVHSFHLLCGAGNVSARSGLAYFIFSAGQSMDPKSAFYSADGDLLIILQHGVLDIRTELGHLLVRPNEICVIPRGIR
jgi:homogentisate 1,2-dioxygenase